MLPKVSNYSKPDRGQRFFNCIPKRYFCHMKKDTALFLLFFCCYTLYTQEIRRFTVQDFDLKGPVQSCVVLTRYGKESFEFNEAGFLTKAVTRYNDQDQDLTYYQYHGGELVEKREERYRDKALDAATSLVTLYTIDVTPRRKVTENVVSYNKAFMEQREYRFSDAGRLLKVITSRKEGVDETTLVYTSHDDGHTTRTFVNGVLTKSVTTSGQESAQGPVTHIRTQVYIEGIPHQATQEVYNDADKLLSKKVLQYNEAQAAFVSEEKSRYHYDPEGLLQKVVTQTADTALVQEYHFQCDAHAAKNWVKQVITPANTYTTRSITYYTN